MKPVSQWGTNWQGAAGRAQSAYTQGVEGYTGDWAAATVRQQAAMLSGVTNAVNSGLWANRVNSTGTAGWKAATTAKVANYGNGYTAGVGNYNAAAAKIGPAIQNGLAGLGPRGDIYANLDRSRALALYLHGLKGQLGAK